MSFLICDAAGHGNEENDRMEKCSVEQKAVSPHGDKECSLIFLDRLRERWRIFYWLDCGIGYVKSALYVTPYRFLSLDLHSSILVEHYEDIFREHRCVGVFVPGCPGGNDLG